MAFVLTKYIYPLEKKISFFNEPNYCFDNPRTKEELQLVKEFISKTLEFERESKGDPGETFRLIFGISELRKFLEKTAPMDYASKYYSSTEDKMLIDILTETWIIVRFDDDGHFEKLSTNRNDIFHLILTKQKNLYTENYEKLLNISHILSVIANDDQNYHGETFILSRNPYSIFYSIERHEIHNVLEHFGGMNSLLKEDNRVIDWLYWIDGKEKLSMASNKLLSIFHQPAIIIKNTAIKPSQKQTPAQKLLHIGNHLKMSYSHISDPELNLILLVGIFEFLVTRQPDTNRFNIEDSIVKQFRLKCSVLIHAQDKNIPIEEISNHLQTIYSKRSDFAHGNYVDGYDSQTTVKLVLLLFNYLSKTLNAYISDRHLVEYLKDN